MKVLGSQFESMTEAAGTDLGCSSRTHHTEGGRLTTSVAVTALRNGQAAAVTDA